MNHQQHWQRELTEFTHNIKYTNYTLYDSMIVFGT